MSLLTPQQGYYGKFGGNFIPELLIAPLHALKNKFDSLKVNQSFMENFHRTLVDFAARPTPLTEVARFSEKINGPQIFLKREDCLHTGAHKINNALGQCLLAKEMGKTHIIAETGAGQHGVATATAAARLGLECRIYMGEVDMNRQAPNVQRMHLLGAEVISVKNGTRTLKDAVSEALRDWSATFENSHYCLGSALGPDPYPEMVETFQRVIGEEAKAQCFAQTDSLPHTVVACVGGGSNAIGIFSAFIDDDVNLVGVEAGGNGDQLGQHAARFHGGSPGVFHGCYTYMLQNEDGQVATTHSVSAGLDYPMVSPQHAALFESKRATYHKASDAEALAACKFLASTEGILPALESSHALAYVIKHAAQFPKAAVVIINLSGRGDKDLGHFTNKAGGLT